MTAGRNLFIKLLHKKDKSHKKTDRTNIIAKLRLRPINKICLRAIKSQVLFTAGIYFTFLELIDYNYPPVRKKSLRQTFNSCL